MTNDRIELHTESRCSENLSFLSGYDIVRAAKGHGCTAIAITDLNSASAYIEAEAVLSKRNIPMIYGITISCVDAEDRYDVVLLAKSIVGRDNIFRLVELMHENYPQLGHAVTRKQLDTYRDGTLMGAAAHNGQLVRAVQHRRNRRYLELISKDYDYIEFVPEPYDISAEIFQLARKLDIPLCAVQHAVLSDEHDLAEYHSYCALNEYYLSDIKPVCWKSTVELEDEIKTLYVLPDELETAQKMIFEAPQRIAAQIQQMPSVSSLLTEGQAQWHKETMPKLRFAVETSIQKKFGANCPEAIQKRIEAELILIDEYQAAPVFLYLSTLETAQDELESCMVSGIAENFEILHLWGLSQPDPMPRHIWCPECGCWEEVDLEIGAKAQCPRCGQTVIASGLNLPAESLHTVLHGGGNFEFKCSKKTMELLESKLRKFTHAKILQAQLGMLAEPHSESLDVKIAEDYLGRNPELADRLRGNDNFSYYIHIGRRNTSEDTFNSENSIYDWCFFPSNNYSLLQHLPTYQTDHNVYRLLIKAYHSMALPTIMTVFHKGLDLLAACETAIKIKPDKNAIYEPEIYQKISAQVSDAGEKDSLVEQACGAFSLNLHSYSIMEREILKLMPLRGYEDLCRIISVSHGTGTWFENAEELLKHGTVTPEQIITCREDIMEYLIRRSCKREIAFEIMEYVRKGHASQVSKKRKTSFEDHHLEALRECSAEDWFVKSCQKIYYLFPRGHSAAMAAGLAKLVWYAIHAPSETAKVFAEASSDNEY